MKLTLKRKHENLEYTIGDLFINDVWFCNTIEDTIRDLPNICPNTNKGLQCNCSGKIYSKTAIPVGTYRITIEFSPRFKRRLPYLHNVPHFLGILIHPGNTEKDSSGCIIVGMNTIKGKVLQSRITSDKLNALLEEELKKGNKITIQIL